MKFIVTGSNGALGYDLVKELENRDYDVLKGTRENMDVTNRELVFDTVTKYHPDVIIHPAAYTQVDMAETMEEFVMNTNGYGTKNVIDAAKKVGAKVIYVSTDYVFDGTKDGVYEVDDQTNPLGIYAKSKLLGEEFTKEYDKSFIVRTTGVFGSFGNNFVKTMLRLSDTHDEVSVVDDQIMSPTYTVDLAKLLVDMSLTDKYGTYHATNKGYISWATFAEEIFGVFEKDTKVNKITTEEYLSKQTKTIAPRPMNSRLSSKSLKQNGFNPLPFYLDALVRYKNELEPKKKEVYNPKTLILK